MEQNFAKVVGGNFHVAPACGSFPEYNSLAANQNSGSAQLETIVIIPA